MKIARENGATAEDLARALGVKLPGIETIADLERLVGRAGDVRSVDELEKLFRLE